MTKEVNQANTSMQDDLIALVSGTLDKPDFERVSSAVAKDPGLQLALQQLEMIHAGVLRNAVPADDEAAVAAITTRVLNQISATAATPTTTDFTATRLRNR